MFQLQHIIIHKHPVFGYADLDFRNNVLGEETNGGIMTTVIIGKNGIGKSYLLRAIIDIFKTIDGFINTYDEASISDLPYKYSIQYYLNGHEYGISNIQEGLQSVGRNTPRSYHLTRDGQNVDWQKIQLPQNVIASSMNIADKFPTPSVGIYKYRGIRSEKTPSTTGTRTIVRKAVEGIIDSLANKHTTREELAELLSELGFQPHLEIRYKMHYKNVFLRSDMSPELLQDIYTNWKSYFKGRSGEVWGAKYFRTLSKYPEKISKICSFLQKSAEEGYFITRPLSYDVFDEHNTLVADSEAIKILSNLDILTFPVFKVFKEEKDEGYDFVNSSSGETQQLCQFISIMSVINNNSLILIDEPENSSHPNWQMNYVGWLQKIFHRYRNCHFLIATHSHFLLTDLRPDWSSIIALDRVSDRLTNIAEGINTFCWSTDDILYRVFKVRNTRNYVFESQMMKLYNYLSNREMSDPKAQELLEELKSYRLNDDDPLLELIKMAENA